MRTNEWIVTDPSCNQMRLTIIEDEEYIFREDRVINPETGEKEIFQRRIKYSQLTWGEIVNACETFGYNANQVDKWMTEGEEIPLMLECVFELLN